MLTRPLPFAAILLTLGCALPADEGRDFRRRLESLRGQPVASLHQELGEPHVEAVPGGGQRHSWTVASIGGSECPLVVTTDQLGRITATRLDGSDHACGTMAAFLGEQARLERADPQRRERLKALIGRLVQARSDLAN